MGWRNADERVALDFPHVLGVGIWFNVPALVCQVLLLLTFLVLPEEVSHRHYLSVGLCFSLILCEVRKASPSSHWR